MSSDAPNIVFVDDDSSFRRIMGREIERMGFAVDVFPDADGVRDRVASTLPSAVLLDLNMPGQSGMELLAELLQDDPGLQVIVLTGHGSVSEAVDAMRRGAFDFLTKPVSLDVLEQTLRKAVTTAELIAENRRLRRVAESDGSRVVVLESPAARRLEGQVVRIGPSEKSVLVTGESGVGKELVARMLHDTSPRREGPFVPVNCGAIPRQLIESELFGHSRGAFTGADRKRVGLFEAADRGTLFLDEIGELPLELQPALLRAIQFGEIRPVGGETTRNVDVRIVAATHRDLRARVAEQTFREDLFYRIAIFELHVPSLRERVEDISPLARHFLRRESRRSDRPLSLSADAEAWLEHQDWPGNVRELENAIVRLSVLASGSEIDLAAVRDVLDPTSRARRDGGLPTLELRELERLAIAEAMRRHRGNKRAAAAELGIALKTLYNKLAKEPGEA
ncbi:MAG: sigma-54-dependent Fis family transcriptional regulator [Planctomycetes bacterium]|nr:sigma-54-dependent Fis family transcriptional regulator [Planctomycetota bacterium]